MSFLSKLFKPKQPETLEQRIAALGAFEQHQLFEIAQSQEEPFELRAAAIKGLTGISQLTKMCTNNSDSQNIRNAAQKRIGELLDDNLISVEQLANEVTEPTIFLSICGYSSQAATKAIEQIDDQNILLEMAKTGTTTQLRQSAAEKITDKAALEALFKQAKNKDKSVYKIVKGKLDIFKQEKAKQNLISEKINSLSHQAEQLAKQKLGEVFTARLAQLEESWASLEDQSNAEDRARFIEARNRCRKLIDDAEQAEREKQQQLESEVAAKADVTDALNTLSALFNDALENSQPTSLADPIQTAISELDERLIQAESKDLNIQAEKSKRDRLAQSCAFILDNLNNEQSFPQLVDAVMNNPTNTSLPEKQLTQEILNAVLAANSHPQAAIVAKAQEALKASNNALKKQSTEKAEQLKFCNELIRKGQWATSQGHVGRARAIFRDLKGALDNIDPIPSHIASKYEDLEKSIDKLGDWHSFAVTPKKQQLADEMQALIGCQLAPQDLADKIQDLQNQWKELCRGGQNQDEALWQAFHAASQTAYEPCKTYFEEQAQSRELNASQRRTLIQQLNEYLKAYDWENANWNEVEKTLKISRDAWQSYWPIPRKDIKPLQSEFDAIMDNLYDKLNAEFDRNKTKKRNIIDNSEKLLNEQNTVQAIETAKQLQHQWKAIGRCKRKDEQSLWSEFRTNCDKIFEKRQEENQKSAEEREANKAEAEKILQQLSSIATLDGDAFFQEKSNVEGLSDQFKAIGELPRDSSKAINQSFQTQLKAIDSKTQKERQKAVVGNWQAIFHLNQALCEAESSSETASNELINALSEKIESHSRWPGDCKKQLTERLQILEKGAASPSESAEQQLRLICVKAEVANELESPAEDKDIRLNYQVTMLKQSFGHTGVDQDQLSSYVAEWLSVAGCPIHTYTPLEERFMSIFGLQTQAPENA